MNKPENETKKKENLAQKSRKLGGAGAMWWGCGVSL
jgi:hypothetical protein